MIRIAIVEDNADLLDELLFNLRHQGFEPEGFPDGAALDAALAAQPGWQVLVLDLGLPGEDGLSIARRLRRSHPALGIVMLTARGGIDDRVDGLTQGADLYLAKPVDMKELGASIHAVARRVGQIAGVRLTWRLDTLGRRLSSPEGRVIDLTHPEVMILAALARSREHLLDRAALITAIGKNPDTYDQRALEVTVSRLRQKLGAEAPLRAVRGKGYAFNAPLRVSAAPPVGM